jgi:hypothetical protein
MNRGRPAKQQRRHGIGTAARRTRAQKHNAPVPFHLFSPKSKQGQLQAKVPKDPFVKRRERKMKKRKG